MKLKWLLILVLLFPVSMFGRVKLQGYVEQGNTTLTITGGIGNITRKVQGSFPGSTVTVYLTGTVTLATLYADNSGTPKANPFTSSSDGSWFFYADNGRYDVRFSGVGISSPYTLSDFMLVDALDVVDSFCNVKNFGAIGDGIADDTSSIQSAINSCQAQSLASSTVHHIQIPTGHYKITSTLNIAYPVIIEGEYNDGAQVNLNDYPLRGAVLQSAITDGSKVVNIIGYDGGDGKNYVNGVHIKNVSIEGTGTDGSGFSCVVLGSIHDLIWDHLSVRGVGGSSFQIGTGVNSTSPSGIFYSSFTRLFSWRAGLDGVLFSAKNFLNTSITDSHVGNSGRNGYAFYGTIGIVASNLSENNAGRLMSGSSFRFTRVISGTFTRLFAEGAGRLDTQGGFSLTPIGNTSYGFFLDGSHRNVFIDCHSTLAVGDVVTPNNSGLFQISQNDGSNGWSVGDSSNNSFYGCTVSAFSPRPAAPVPALAGLGAGNVDNGVHGIIVTMVYDNAWEIPLSGCVTNSVTVVDKTANGQIDIASLPIGTSYTNPGYTPVLVTARKIYATKANGSIYYLLATVPDNSTTSYLYNVADTALTVAAEFTKNVFIDTHSGSNVFQALSVPGDPFVSDNYHNNNFFNLYQLNIPPANQAYQGMANFSSFNDNYIFSNLNLTSVKSLSTVGSAAIGTTGTFGSNVDVTGNIRASVGIGVGSLTVTPKRPIDVFALRGFIGSDVSADPPSRTANTEKRFHLGLPDYVSGNTVANNFGFLNVYSTATSNFMLVGGGSTEGYAATEIEFYTAANTTTATGTERFRITKNGHFIAPTDNTYDIGASGATRPRTGYFGTSVITPTLSLTNGANTNSLQSTALTGNHVATFPNEDITVPGTRTYNGGTTSTYTPVDISSTVIIHSGTVALVSGTPSAVTVSAFSPAFTSSATYVCTATPAGNTATIAGNGIAVVKVDGTSITLTGPDSVTTIANYICIGN